ncbi:MAG TPA: hypothetical protein VNH46_11100 [Gemmatimonadales bacterium]|nr:hypothetical protein [Gemmatimonadales bacterium]
MSDTLRIPPEVEVVDERGRPVPDVAVSFRVVEGGGSIEAVPALTGADGRVATTRWVLGPGPGSNVVEARAEGLAPARFTATGRTAIQVAVGLNHSCLLDSGGTVRCWGNNRNGQLGTGDTLASPTPTPVIGGLSFTSVSAAELHTCGLTAAGQAFCWGWGVSGQLGDGSYQSAASPRAVSGGYRFANVRAGPGATCGVTVGGQVLCWGYLLQAGIYDSTPTPLSIPPGSGSTDDLAIGRLGQVCALSPPGAPRCVPGGTGYYGGASDVQQIGLGKVSVCGVSRSLGVVCQGQTPAGPIIPVALPSPAEHLSEHWSQWSGNLSEADSGCVGVMASGVYCWTPNNGPTTAALQPGTEALGRITSLATAQGHVCVVTRMGAVWCWGQNTMGQLGDGTLEPSATPVRVHLFNKGRVPPR